MILWLIYCRPILDRSYLGSTLTIISTIIYPMQRLYQLLFPTLVLLALAIPARANDCGSATTVSVGNPATLTFDGIPSGLSPSGFPFPAGDAWFEYVPGGAAGTVQDLTIEITANANCQVNILFLYSELFEAGYTACNTLALHNPLANQTLTGGTTYNYQVSGVDATGHYFIAVEIISGAGTQVTVEPVVQATNPVAANDDCNNATVLTMGNGIDPDILTGPTAGVWTNGANLSTRNGTKERLQAGCNAGITQDHYTNSSFGCFTNGNLGDNGLLTLFNQNPCKTSLMNTTFYKFVAPMTSNDFTIHFGSASQCAQEPNRVFVMLYDENAGFTCGNAKTSVSSGSLMGCQAFPVFGALPVADFTFSNVSLVSGRTYWIVLDGDRGAQCDLQVLVSRGTNPILPVTLSYFTGQHREGINHLSWETESEDLHDRFMIQRSTDGDSYERIGEFSSNGGINQRTAYTFDDLSSPVGTSFYRLEMIDINGGITFSNVVELSRTVDRVTVLGLVPNPASETSDLIISSPERIDAAIELFDLQGKQVGRQHFESEAGEHKASLNLRALSPGLYLVKVRTSQGTFTEKLVVK